MQNTLIINTPIGHISVMMDGGVPAEVNLLSKQSRAKSANNSPWLKAWFDAYFEDARNWSKLEVHLEGTVYQRRVWAALREIDAGEIITYGKLARQLGSAPRAVGQACRANPCPLIVPCHRVVAANGRGGFAGETEGRLPAIKSWLLSHEGISL